MRSFQVFTVALCLLAGGYLVVVAPSFFLSERWDPSIGHQFEAFSARLLGLGLLTIAWSGLRFMRTFYSDQRYRLDARWQRINFVLLLTAIGLISAAFYYAERMPDPARGALPPASFLSPSSALVFHRATQ